KKRADQLEHALVGHPLGDPPHQDVVVNSVKELFQVNIHGPSIAFGQVLLGLSHRLMGAPPGAESIAVLGERRIPAALKDLHDRLLDETVQYGGDAKLAHPAIWLGNFHAFHRLWLVGPAQKLLANRRPLLTQVIRKFANGHPVHSRTPLVGHDSCQRFFQIITLTYLLHQLFDRRQTFGFAFRHGRFSPSAGSRRDFIPTLRHEGQQALVFLLLAAHESRVVLVFPFTPLRENRSGLPGCHGLDPHRLFLSFRTSVPRAAPTPVLRPLLTSALRSKSLATLPVWNPRHNAD